jgi:diguanylate cyclase (GGDEF)-like protein
MNKKILLFLIPITVLSPLFLYSLFPYNAIWSLMILPGILLIAAFPSWRVAVLVAFFLSTVKYSFAFISQDMSRDMLIEFMVGTITNHSVLFTVAYCKIQYNRALRETRELTLVDQLTGVYNRRYFDFYMEKTITLSNKTGIPLHIILLDIDYFKAVNDTYGHSAGDNILKQVAGIIQDNIRASDGLVRIGGEEFVVLVPETTTKECLQIAERIRTAVSNAHFTHRGKHIPITISAGVAKYARSSAAHFIHQADQALYQAKAQGRNQVVVAQ